MIPKEFWQQIGLPKLLTAVGMVFHVMLLKKAFLQSTFLTWVLKELLLHKLAISPCLFLLILVITTSMPLFLRILVRFSEILSAWYDSHKFCLLGKILINFVYFMILYSCFLFQYSTSIKAIHIWFLKIKEKIQINK